jgi:hypothetical protein
VYENPEAIQRTPCPAAGPREEEAVRAAAGAGAIEVDAMLVRVDESRQHRGATRAHAGSFGGAIERDSSGCLPTPASSTVARTVVEGRRVIQRRAFIEFSPAVGDRDLLLR